MIITVSSAIDKLVMVYHSLALELFPDVRSASFPHLFRTKCSSEGYSGACPPARLPRHSMGVVHAQARARVAPSVSYSSRYLTIGLGDD